MSSQEESSNPQCSGNEQLGGDVSPVYVSHARITITPTGSPKGSSQELSDEQGHPCQVDTMLVSPPRPRGHTHPHGSPESDSRTTPQRLPVIRERGAFMAGFTEDQQGFSPLLRKGDEALHRGRPVVAVGHVPPKGYTARQWLKLFSV